MPDRGPWMQTFTGEAFYPFDPRYQEVNIIDIASALSKQCRFAGHCKNFYSVAQHSVHVCKLVEGFCKKLNMSDYDISFYMLNALLHDAAEAYCLDFPHPIKIGLLEYTDIYKKLEHNIQNTIITALFDNIDKPKYLNITHMENMIHYCDNIALATEKRDNMGKSPMPWIELPDPDSEFLICYNHVTAYNMFIEKFNDLINKLGGISNLDIYGE